MTKTKAFDSRLRLFGKAGRLGILALLAAAAGATQGAELDGPLVLAAQAAPVVLSWSAFYERPIGPKGLVFSAKLMALQDRWVQLSGYRVKTEWPTPGWFLLAPLRHQVSPEEDGDANDLPASTVFVAWDAPLSQESAAHEDDLLVLQGCFHWGAQAAPGGQTYWFSLNTPPCDSQ